ncbi:hypothetical protein J2797_003762 [Paraburkholderia terricola]|uniref:Uncharacterized protein n=1 Tax=Paraburkholderia terricola TaxID=169427 RepID=A0A1M6U7R4_9BURK|nr:hypothetical protein [Paraburkholderia terricola]SDO89020.1 hypothetical protein SAMN05192547_103169 [Paraburkholderia sediminicola]MDR6449336.1 hypothetical protein [Paraburkholderia terricola]MDR6484117.1 hypothetical protein [Paraburkholderia terricola]MDR6493859.1 hypothetical protein [Paraburkholderia terricola]
MLDGKQAGRSNLLVLTDGAACAARQNRVSRGAF